MDMAEARRRIAVVHQTGSTSLDLSGLGLTALPPEIAALTALKVLELNNNQLTALAPEIGALTALKELYLANNQLTALPPEIAALTALQRLDLDGNPLHRTHFDALEHGISNLFAFVHRLAGDTTPL